MDQQDLWILSFVPAAGHGAPPEVRVRRLLKAALRCYGLRCTRVAGPRSADLKEPKPPPLPRAA